VVDKSWPKILYNLTIIGLVVGGKIDEFSNEILAA